MSGGTLVDLMERAKQRADVEGYYSAGTKREVRVQRLIMCGDPHDGHRWRLAEGGPPKCGVCHAPAPGLEVVAA